VILNPFLAFSDRVSEEAQRLLAKVQDATPSDVTWVHRDFPGLLSKEIEEFLVRGKRLQSSASLKIRWLALGLVESSPMAS
jgi:hypothetical protein